jgi:hypothetical protein
MRSLFALLLCTGLALSLASSRAVAQCASGTITVTASVDPAFPNQFKYCVSASWNLGQHELSHLDVFLGLPDCPCICDPRFIGFNTPAGSSTPTGDSCVLDYTGQYVCKGDPSLPPGMNGPAVKFIPDPNNLTCDPSISGSGTFCFYSPMPPQAPTTHTNAIAIKHGQEVCYATLEGSLPSCDCALPAQSMTWGCMKSMYR